MGGRRSSRSISRLDYVSNVRKCIPDNEDVGEATVRNKGAGNGIVEAIGSEEHLRLNDLLLFGVVK